MQFQSIIAVLSLAVAASAVPTGSTSSSCGAPQVVACCDSFKNGTGVGCIFSTLNLLNPTCAASQSTACCSAPQSGLINVQCVPISVAL